MFADHNSTAGLRSIASSGPGALLPQNPWSGNPFPASFARGPGSLPRTAWYEWNNTQRKPRRDRGVASGRSGVQAHSLVERPISRPRYGGWATDTHG